MRSIFGILAFIISIIVSPCFSQSPTYSGLTYGPDGANKLDIYMPTGGTQPYPVVVWIHGGGWSSGSRTGGDETNLASMLGPKGIAIVSIDYRLSGAAQWPAQIQDCKAAIRWIRANASTYHFNTNEIGCAGMSAGGHLVAFLGTSGGVGSYTVGSSTMDLEGSVGGNSSYSSKVQCVLDMYGPTDFLTMSGNCPQNNPAVSTIDHNGATSPEASLLGAAIQTVPDKCALANPITFVDANDPPFLILHGSSDALVPCCNSMLLDTALAHAYASNHREAKMYLLSGQGHGFSVTVMRDTVIAFFTRTLRSTGIEGKESAAAAKTAVDIFVKNSRLMVCAAVAFELNVTDIGGRLVLSKHFLPTIAAEAMDLRGVGAGILICTLRADNQRGQSNGFVVCEIRKYRRYGGGKW